jgi:hypothetical protein
VGVHKKNDYYIPYHNILKYNLLAGNKIEHIACSAGMGAPIEFGISASGAGTRCKFSVLNVEILCKPGTGCSYMIYFGMSVATFRASITFLIHVNKFKVYKISLTPPVIITIQHPNLISLIVLHPLMPYE